ncbi:hypothetical protein O7632_13290 [Solwaraspora sp. WMMD406]|uniref:WXG100-like domain-containing protein n=1 Tax=Solwaraspora sp. WMMD406 TaxID=3016095 RepID=UPI002415FD8D|nr:hypothetical protein [Solwaraspora sp. WMMD406]MDG4765065.1 hypothetical protein [Solwaraspora sp. WMMD406]
MIVLDTTAQQWMLFFFGDLFPTGNEVGLRWFSRDLVNAADDVDVLAEYAVRVLAAARRAGSGAAVDAMERTFGQYTSSPPAYFDQLGSQLRGLGRYSRDTATLVEYFKWMLIADLVETLAEFAFTVAWSWLYPGLLPQFAARTAARRAVIGQVRRRLVVELASGAVVVLGMQVAMDVLVQKLQFLTGGRDVWDASLTEAAAKTGGLSALFGAGIGLGRGGLGRDGGGFLGDVVDGMLNEGLTTFALTGAVDPFALTAGGVGGVFEGLGERLGPGNLRLPGTEDSWEAGGDANANTNGGSAGGGGGGGGGDGGDSGPVTPPPGSVAPGVNGSRGDRDPVPLEEPADDADGAGSTSAGGLPPLVGTPPPGREVGSGGLQPVDAPREQTGDLGSSPVRDRSADDGPDRSGLSQPAPDPTSGGTASDGRNDRTGTPAVSDTSGVARVSVVADVGSSPDHSGQAYHPDRPVETTTSATTSADGTVTSVTDQVAEVESTARPTAEIDSVAQQTPILLDVAESNGVVATSPVPASDQQTMPPPPVAQTSGLPEERADSMDPDPDPVPDPVPASSGPVVATVPPWRTDPQWVGGTTGNQTGTPLAGRNRPSANGSEPTADVPAPKDPTLAERAKTAVSGPVPATEEGGSVTSGESSTPSMLATLGVSKTSVASNLVKAVFGSGGDGGTRATGGPLSRLFGETGGTQVSHADDGDIVGDQSRSENEDMADSIGDGDTSEAGRAEYLDHAAIFETNLVDWLGRNVEVLEQANIMLRPFRGYPRELALVTSDGSGRRRTPEQHRRELQHLDEVIKGDDLDAKMELLTALYRSGAMARVYGVTFEIPQEFYAERREFGGDWHRPEFAADSVYVSAAARTQALVRRGTSLPAYAMMSMALQAARRGGLEGFDPQVFRRTLLAGMVTSDGHTAHEVLTAVAYAGRGSNPQILPYQSHRRRYRAIAGLDESILRAKVAPEHLFPDERQDQRFARPDIVDDLSDSASFVTAESSMTESSMTDTFTTTDPVMADPVDEQAVETSAGQATGLGQVVYEREAAKFEEALVQWLRQDDDVLRQADVLLTPFLDKPAELARVAWDSGGPSRTADQRDSDLRHLRTVIDDNDLSAKMELLTALYRSGGMARVYGVTFDIPQELGRRDPALPAYAMMSMALRAARRGGLEGFDPEVFRRTLLAGMVNPGRRTAHEVLTAVAYAGRTREPRILTYHTNPQSYHTIAGLDENVLRDKVAPGQLFPDEWQSASEGKHGEVLPDGHGVFSRPDDLDLASWRRWNTLRNRYGWLWEADLTASRAGREADQVDEVFALDVVLGQSWGTYGEETPPTSRPDAPPITVDSYAAVGAALTAKGDRAALTVTDGGGVTREFNVIRDAAGDLVFLDPSTLGLAVLPADPQTLSLTWFARGQETPDDRQVNLATPSPAPSSIEPADVVIEPARPQMPTGSNSSVQSVPANLILVLFGHLLFQPTTNLDTGLLRLASSVFKRVEPVVIAAYNKGSKSFQVGGKSYDSAALAQAIKERIVGRNGPVFLIDPFMRNNSHAAERIAKALGRAVIVPAADSQTRSDPVLRISGTQWWVVHPRQALARGRVDFYSVNGSWDEAAEYAKRGPDLAPVDDARRAEAEVVTRSDHSGRAKYELRRYELAPRLVVREYTIKVHLDGVVDDTVARSRIEGEIDEELAGINRPSLRLPASGDRVVVRLEYVDDPARAHLSVTVAAKGTTHTSWNSNLWFTDEPADRRIAQQLIEHLDGGPNGSVYLGSTAKMLDAIPLTDLPHPLPLAGPAHGDVPVPPALSGFRRSGQSHHDLSAPKKRWGPYREAEDGPRRRDPSEWEWRRFPVTMQHRHDPANGPSKQTFFEPVRPLVLRKSAGHGADVDIRLFEVAEGVWVREFTVRIGIRRGEGVSRRMAIRLHDAVQRRVDAYFNNAPQFIGTESGPPHQVHVRVEFRLLKPTAADLPVTVTVVSGVSGDANTWGLGEALTGGSVDPWFGVAEMLDALGLDATQRPLDAEELGVLPEEDLRHLDELTAEPEHPEFRSALSESIKRAQVLDDESWHRSSLTMDEAWWSRPDDPAQPQQWEFRRAGLTPITVDTSLVEVSGDGYPDGPLQVAYDGAGRFDLARFEVEHPVTGKKTLVREHTLRLHLKLTNGVSEAELTRLKRRSERVLYEVSAEGNRLPNGDQFAVRVDFVDDPANAHEIVSVANVATANARGYHSQDQWSSGMSDQTILHEVLHYLLLRDEYRDRVALRSTDGGPGRQNRTDDGVMGAAKLFDRRSLMARYLWQMEKRTQAVTPVPIDGLAAFGSLSEAPDLTPYDWQNGNFLSLEPGHDFTDPADLQPTASIFGNSTATVTLSLSLDEWQDLAGSRVPRRVALLAQMLAARLPTATTPVIVTNPTGGTLSSAAGTGLARALGRPVIAAAAPTPAMFKHIPEGSALWNVHGHDTTLTFMAERSRPVVRVNLRDARWRAIDDNPEPEVALFVKVLAARLPAGTPVTMLDPTGVGVPNIGAGLAAAFGRPVITQQSPRIDPSATSVSWHVDWSDGGSLALSSPVVRFDVAATLEQGVTHVGEIAAALDGVSVVTGSAVGDQQLLDALRAGWVTLLRVSYNDPGRVARVVREIDPSRTESGLLIVVAPATSASATARLLNRPVIGVVEDGGLSRYQVFGPDTGHQATEEESLIEAVNLIHDGDRWMSPLLGRLSYFPVPPVLQFADSRLRSSLTDLKAHHVDGTITFYPTVLSDYLLRDAITSLGRAVAPDSPQRSEVAAFVLDVLLAVTAVPTRRSQPTVGDHDNLDEIVSLTPPRATEVLNDLAMEVAFPDITPGRAGILESIGYDSRQPLAQRLARLALLNLHPDSRSQLARDGLFLDMLNSPLLWEARYAGVVGTAQPALDPVLAVHDAQVRTQMPTIASVVWLGRSVTETVEARLSNVHATLASNGPDRQPVERWVVQARTTFDEIENDVRALISDPPEGGEAQARLEALTERWSQTMQAMPLPLHADDDSDGSVGTSGEAYREALGQVIDHLQEPTETMTTTSTGSEAYERAFDEALWWEVRLVGGIMITAVVAGETRPLRLSAVFVDGDRRFVVGDSRVITLSEARTRSAMQDWRAAGQYLADARTSALAKTGADSDSEAGRLTAGHGADSTGEEVTGPWSPSNLYVPDRGQGVYANSGEVGVDPVVDEHFPWLPQVNLIIRENLDPDVFALVKNGQLSLAAVDRAIRGRSRPGDLAGLDPAVRARIGKRDLPTSYSLTNCHLSVLAAEMTFADREADPSSEVVFASLDADPALISGLDRDGDPDWFQMSSYQQLETSMRAAAEAKSAQSREPGREPGKENAAAASSRARVRVQAVEGGMWHEIIVVTHDQLGVVYLDPQAGDLAKLPADPYAVWLQSPTAALRTGPHHSDAGPFAEVPVAARSGVVGGLFDAPVKELIKQPRPNAVSIAALKEADLHKLAASEVSMMSPGVLRLLSAGQVAALNISMLTATQMAELTADAISGIRHDQVAGHGSIPSSSSSVPMNDIFAQFTADQFAALRPEAISGLRPDQWQKLSDSEPLTALSAEQIAHQPATADSLPRGLPPGLIKSLPDGVVTRLSRALSVDHVRELAPSAVRSLTRDQVARIPPDAIAGLTAAQVQDIRPAALAGLTPAQLLKVTPDAIAGLTPAQLLKVTPDAIAGLTPAQLLKVTPDAIAGLTPAQVDRFKLSTIAGLTAAQMGKMTWASVNGLSRAQARTLSDSAVKAIRPDLLRDDPATGEPATIVTKLDDRQIPLLPSLAELGSATTKGLSETAMSSLTAARSDRSASMLSTRFLRNS